MKKILIVEDDKMLSNGIVLSLQNNSYEFCSAYTLADAKNQINKQAFDLIVLDINLPDGSGVDFLAKFRKSHNTPVILLTANDLELDIVTGLESGANDYITKPFSLAVLRARVNNQLRPKKDADVISIDSFRFDFQRMEFQKKDTTLELSKTEQKLLRALIDNKGIILSREVLRDKIWRDGTDFVDDNALSVSIKRLRDKLEDTPSDPDYIKTIYGIGYMWGTKNE